MTPAESDLGADDGKPRPEEPPAEQAEVESDLLAEEGFFFRCPSCGEASAEYRDTCPSCGADLTDLYSAGYQLRMSPAGRRIAQFALFVLALLVLLAVATWVWRLLTSATK